MAPVLELERIDKCFGQKVVADDLTLSVDQGEFFTFLGPSGSGKSTVLRMVAGLETPDSGRVLIAGQDMRGVPPWRRNLGMVFQQYAVFPHMTVAQNVRYGLTVRGQSRAKADARVKALIDLVGLSGMANKNVTLLSGGEQQRVAVARALAPEPSMLLFDEPLGALDEKIRREMQIELRHIQRETGTTFLYVTHDQEEALTMSDRIAVLHDGSCVQCDSPEVIFKRPRTRFVAEFFRGCNVLSAELLGVEQGRSRVRLADLVLGVLGDGAGSPGRIELCVRSENVRIADSAAACDVQFEGALREVIYRGTNTDHELVMPDGQTLVATSTRNEVEGTPANVRIGFDEADVILLENGR